MNPDTCEICGEYVGVTYDVHMVLQHPETRRKPDPRPSEKKKKRGKVT